MAELQLSLPYKSTLNRVAVAGVVVFLPFWSFLLPGLIGAFIGFAIQYHQSISPPITALVLAVLVTLEIGSFLFSAQAEENRIHVSRNGMSFPPFLAASLRFRSNWFWNDLIGASLLNVDDPKRSTLLLAFGSGASLPLKLRYLSKANLEELFLAIELWGASCTRAPELIEFQNNLQNENKGLDRLGYTQMWEEELSRRFNATAFLPLEPKHKLQRGKLEVVRQLAFGGLSAIYLVQRDGTDMFVLKEAVVPLDADPEQREQAEQHLARESMMLFCLFHPNIAHVVDHFVEEGRHYLLLEYVNGQDLRQLVQQNGVRSEAEAIEWALQIADALAFVHSQTPAVIHRDVTPDNIVLKNDGTVVLIDFGAANEFIGTATGTMVGKQAYIAPEQLRGKAAPQSDLYALGGTLMYLLTGRDPVPLSESDLKEKRPDCSDGMRNLILSLTRFDKAERMQTAGEAIEALRSLAGKEEVKLAQSVELLK